MLKLASQLNKTGKLYYSVLTCSKKHSTTVHDVYIWPVKRRWPITYVYYYYYYWLT